jgi:hypothetical protein
MAFDPKDPTKAIDAGVKELTSAFKHQTIQRVWSFLADFLDSDLAELIPGQRIISVSLPFFTLSNDKIHQSSQPQAFATYEGEPFEFSFTVLESAYGNARTLAQQLAARIRQPNGIFNPPNQAKFGMGIKLIDYSGHLMDVYQVVDIMYQSAEALTLSYEGSEAMAISFSCVADEIKRVGVGNQ